MAKATQEEILQKGYVDLKQPILNFNGVEVKFFNDIPNTLGNILAFTLGQSKSESHDEAVTKYALIEKLKESSITLKTDEIQVIKSVIVKGFNTEIYLCVLKIIAPNDLK